MRIMPIMTNYAANNIRFRGDVGDLGDDDQYTYYKPQKKRYNGYRPDNMDEQDTVFSQKGCMSALAIGTAAALMTIGASMVIRSNKIQEKFQEETFKTLQSDDIKQDTLLIKDVTNDEQPDIILFKEDGSKVIVDVANQKIIEK